MIFIDLENTLIEDWDSMIPMFDNIRKVKDMLGSCECINIFSWAIFNDNDVETFNKHLRGLIEDSLVVKVKDVITMEKVKDVLGKSYGFKIEDEDFTTFINKETAFERYILQLVECGEIVDSVNMLIDDTVKDKRVSIVREGKEINIEFVKI